MFAILCFSLIYSTNAFILKNNETSENLIPFHPFDDPLLVFEHNVEASDCACENGQCVRDNRGHWKCLCKPRYALQEENKCAECDCGNKGKCFFNEKVSASLSKTFEKKCLCDQEFAEKNGKCIPCVCGKNSKCEFEDNEKICYCKEGFAELQGACEECNCGEGGVCEFKDQKKHCTCHEGFLLNGEKCEECDCGDKGTCSFVNGVRTCHCQEHYLENFGICEECYCGEQSTNCLFNDAGSKHCSCKTQYAQKSGMCSECNCGEQSTNCSFTGHDETKQCSCKDSYAQNSAGQCEKCMCGSATKSCQFGMNDEKQCTCQSGYAVKNGVCTETCRDDNDCHHGSKCESREGAKFCKCKNGLSGDKCETVVDCEEFGKYRNCKGENGKCVYNRNKEIAECLCAHPKKFHPIINMCQDCNCGQKSTSCTYNSGGGKACTCQQNHAQTRAGVCAECTCGHRTRSCSFGSEDEKQCLCQNGYGVKNGICTEICTEDNSCKNGGNCKNEMKDKFCDCKEGTSGDKCETIDDCVAGGRYEHCRGHNGTCVYDVEMRRAVCKCPDGASLNPRSNICEACYCGKMMTTCEFSEEGKIRCSCKEGYAPLSNICTETCSDDEDCKNGGTCVDKEGSKFCECKEGVGGDKCQIVDDCTDSGKYKNCRGENGECGYDAGARKAVCTCSHGKKLNPVNNMCQECTCGHKEECKFADDGRKVCFCEPGFALKDNICTETCNSDADCFYMGVCEGEDVKFCRCKNGLSGDKCEVIDDCGDNGKLKNCRGENGSCGYELNHEKAVCTCTSGKEFNSRNNICQDCSCGTNGKCSFKDGSKVCDCSRGTAVKNGICEECDCGKNSVSCSFVGGEKSCSCADGFVQDNGKCEKEDPCDPNPCVNGQCVPEGREFKCACEPPFIGRHCEINPCVQTSCIGGVCKTYGGVEMCTCPEGQRLIEGYCKTVKCAPGTCFGGRCELVDGIVECVCPPGYHLEGVGCHGNLCKHQHCYGGVCTVLDDHELCLCHDGYTLRNDVCVKMLCEKKNCFGGRCNIVNGEEVCTCPKGFEIKDDTCELILRDDCELEE